MCWIGDPSGFLHMSGTQSCSILPSLWLSNLLCQSGLRTSQLQSESCIWQKRRAWRACLTLEVKADLVRGYPFLKKIVPGSVPHVAVLHCRQDIESIQFSQCIHVYSFLIVLSLNS